MNKILIRFDDICPTMNYTQWQRAVELLDKYGARPLLGIVPDCQDPDLLLEQSHTDFWDYLKKLQARGWALAMHGYQHRFDTEGKGLVNGVRKSEFAGHPYQVQYDKIKKGKAILESHGIFTDIFFAPAHSYDENTLKALAANGFKYLSDGKTSKAVLRYGIICLPCRATGCPKIKGDNRYYTAVFHAHEWTQKGKEKAFGSFCNLLQKHYSQLVDFDTYKRQPQGSKLFQILIEKVYLVLQYKAKPLLLKITNKIIFTGKNVPGK